MTDEWVGVIGASSFVGECLFPLLLDSRYKILALSRRPLDPEDPCIAWRNPNALRGSADTLRIAHWICVAPIWVISEYFDLMAASGATRAVVLSSTSRFTKDRSSDSTEQAIARRLAEEEARFQEWAEANRVEWVVLRPTMIYGLGRDRNLAEIARFIRRFGLFPLFGQATGLRQPIHVQDLAGACLAALRSPAIANRAYNLSGGEVLSYREMVRRVFAALERPPRMFPVPLLFFRFGVALLRLLPRYRGWTMAMAERMNRDLVFDHSDATKDLAFNPRAFELSSEDVSR